MRRTLIILAVVIVLLGAGAAAYYFFFAGTPSVSVAPPGDTSLPSSGQTTLPPGGSATTSVSVPQPPPSSTSVSARLMKISAGPVSPGLAVVDVPAARTASTSTAQASSSPDTLVEYIERQSGNIYQYSENAGQSTRTSNRTIPGIERAFWTPDGRTAFVEYLSGPAFSTVNTYGIAADGSSGFFLPQDLADLAVSSTSVLVLASGVNGSAASLYKPTGSALAANIFTTPLSSLRISFAGKGQYLAFTKPSSTLEGDAYLVSSSGTFTRIAGPLTGLVALASPSGKWALVSSSSGGTMHLALVDIATGATTALPVATIADKCVWAADSSAAYCAIPQSPPTSYAYPDDWYQGAISFNDRIWKVDVAGRYAQLVLDFTNEAKQPLDAESLAVDANGSVLAFINKIDGSLWSYKL